MSETIRQHLAELLDGSSAHISLETALRAFPLNAIHTRVECSPHTAWELVEHIRIAQSDIVSYCRDAQYEEKPFPDGYWNLDAGTAAAWQTSTEQISADLSTLREIVADAAWHILQRPSTECTGNFFIDEEVLEKEGITDFTHYAVNPQQKLMSDLFV